MAHIKVILGSTRPNRFGVQPAKWIMELTNEHKDATFELVDLAEINLPLLDEPQPPTMGNYTQEHTKAWAKIIDEADGFVVVTGEYNFGVPAALKNAFDFLAKEWRYKPVAFVSYGAAAGGARAVEHLRSSVANLGMFDLRDQVILVNYWEQLGENGAFQPTDTQTETAHKLLDNIVFWADHIKPAREKLARQH